MRNVFLLFLSSLSLLFLSCFPLVVFAQFKSTEYVLPYPSLMPGNRLYPLSRFIDRMKAYWYFGTLGKIKYHLMLSDKYLVEAKTLFEYKQYLLGDDALQRSNEHFTLLPEYFEKGTSEQKDMKLFRIQISEAGSKHQDVLTDLITVVPSACTWEAEHEAPVEIPLKKHIQEAIRIRKRVPEYILTR